MQSSMHAIKYYLTENVTIPYVLSFKAAMSENCRIDLKNIIIFI